MRGVLCSLALVVAQASQTAQTPRVPDISLVRASLVPSKSSYFLGERVPIRYCLENISPATRFEAGFGGGAQRFAPIVTDEQGTPAPKPPFTILNADEISGSIGIAPGQQHCVDFELTNYVRLDKPGIFTVSTRYEFAQPLPAIIGNFAPQPKTFGPEAQIKLTFRDPTEAEARRVIAEKGSLGGIFVRPAIYLGPLLDAVREGRIDAIAAIGRIPTPEATRELITLLEHADTQVVRLAASALTSRMPAALEGKLGTLGGFGTDADLLPGWRPQFGPELRAKAKKLLSASDEWEARAGAFILASIGQADDIPAISAALDDAITTRVTRGLANEVTRAAEGIIGRGYAPPAPAARPGDQVIWLVAIGRGARPAGWENTLQSILQRSNPYVQDLALKRIPLPLSDSSIVSLEKLLESSQSDLLTNACAVIQKEGLQSMRPKAFEIFRNTTEKNVFRNCGYAVLVLGPPMEYYDTVLSRLTEGGEIAAASLSALLRVFADTTGGGGFTTIPADEARSLSRRWRVFIDKHRADLEVRRSLSLDDPDATADLVPQGWSLNRRGQSPWPPR